MSRISIDNVQDAVVRWNQLAALCQSLSAQRTISRISEQVALNDELKQYEEGFVGRHVLDPQTIAADRVNSIDELLEANKGRDLSTELCAYDDVAVHLLRARLSQEIPGAHRQIHDSINSAIKSASNNKSSEFDDDQAIFIARLVLPFLAECLTESICYRLEPPYNIYVASNIRHLFLVPIRISIKQNFDEDLDESDAKLWISNFRSHYAEAVRALRGGNLDLITTLLYGRGLNVPESITEEFCRMISIAFFEFALISAFVAERVISGVDQSANFGVSNG